VHQPANAAAAAAAALAAGVDLDQIAIGLGAATGSRWRMEFHRGRFTVVNDAYNANPTSVEAALRTVADLPGRPIAVLGLMAELGEISSDEHIRMGRLAAELGYATVIMVGHDPGLAVGAGAIARNVATMDDALELVARLVRDGDTVLVKASRAVGLEGLAGSLVELAGSSSGSAS
jgi:UDP-N-acetylmuramoyl-tripeptide--D-alanyl-D-alanine ligase